MGKLSPVVAMSFNPLNQVYVFNKEIHEETMKVVAEVGFNPLNQVYVFNER